MMKQHQQKTWAKQAEEAEAKRKALDAAKTESNSVNDVDIDEVVIPTGSNDPQIWWAAAKQDIEKIKSIPDHDDRHVFKAELIEKYREYVEAWLAGDSTDQDDVIAYNVVWAADAGDLDYAITLAEACADRGIKFQMMKSDAVTFVSDVLFVAAEKQFKEAPDEPFSDEFDYVFAGIESGDWSINTSLQARFYRIAGLKAMHEKNDKTALDHLVMADKLKDDIGVKGRIKDLTKKLETAAANKS